MKLDQMIEDLTGEIAELMKVVERKTKERDMLQLEKIVHEKKIDQARMKYRDESLGSQTILDKVKIKLGKLENDKKELEIEN